MAARELTLKDRLSRLTFGQAGKLLGPEGRKLIVQGGKMEIASIEEQVYLGDDLFRLSVDGAVVTITLMAEARHHLHVNCTRCRSVCEHMGAALSLILEEKTVLGLAKPPVERIPVESLSEKELIARALEERQERARTERMTIKSMQPRVLWTDYLVTNARSGKSYRVALRGWDRGDSYCSCPDFRKNTLGICKHIMKVQAKAKRQFTAATRKRPFKPKQFAVHMAYGETLELRLLCPESTDRTVERLIKPLRNQPITQVQALLKTVRRLEAAGYPVTVYPDAEEWIDYVLHREHMTTLVREIRKNPARHPLRKTLLKAELLPYQLDGIAFAAGSGRAVLADDMGCRLSTSPTSRRWTCCACKRPC